MGRGKQHDSKEQAKVLVKKQDFLKKYGSKTQMRSRRKIYGEEEYEKYHQKFKMNIKKE